MIWHEFINIGLITYGERMKLLILLSPKDFKDESMDTIKLFLDKWQVRYDIASYSTKDCVGYHGAVYKPSVNADSVSVSDYDGLMLIDGNGVELYKFYDYRPLLDLVMKFNNANKTIGAIGNAQKIIARANVIKDKRIATSPDEETKRLVILFHGVPSENDFEMSGNIFTVKKSANLQQAMQVVLSHFGVF